MDRIIITLVAIVIGSINMASQSGCCSPTATQEFAALGSAADFRSAHIEPALSMSDEQFGERIEIDVPGGAATVARVFKAEGSPTATILVIHEWWGLNTFVVQQAAKLYEDLGKKADVIAVDLYDGLVATTREAAAKAMQSVDEHRARAILSAVISSVRTEHIGSVGWCFGGGWSLQASLMAGEKAKACVMYYGMPEQDVDTLKKLSAPVLGIFASKDQWITPQIVDTFQANMMSAERMLSVKMYNADHAFANPSNAHHDSDATRDAWENTIEFFTLHLMR